MEPITPLLKICAGFNVPKQDQESFDLYLQSIEKLLTKIILPEIKITSDVERFPSLLFYKINKKLPMIYASLDEKAPCAMSIAALCSAEYTHGVGRFLCDMSSRWLIPGKQIPLVVVRSVNFRFAAHPGQNYFVTELFAEITDPKDLQLIHQNIVNFRKEIRLNILAVMHARRVVSIKPLSLSEKKIIIQENFSSLIDRPSKDVDQNLFDDMHHLIMKASAEDKMMQIKEQITPLLKSRPKIFDRDTFNEVQRFIYLFRDSFTATREIKHLTRIISYQYLFRKSIQNLMIAASLDKRHLSMKLLKTTVHEPEHSRKVLGIIVTLNRIRENEIFEQRHILKSLQTYIPSIRLIEGSYIIDRRDNDRIHTLYLEVEKENERPFEAKELQMLSRRLPRELKSRIETVIHPIFMYRNEEETMRNILILSNQLKYVQDIPQVMASFHKQSDEDITFTVIMLRLIQHDSLKLKNVFLNAKTFLKMHDLEIKIVGLLRKRYPKEANIFEVTFDKRPFLRKDFSIDLYKARQAVMSELTRLIGEIRDYNGGMISKQNEVFQELKNQLNKENVRNEFLLENFFYALSPSYMQSLLPAEILRDSFMILYQMIDEDYQDLYHLKIKHYPEYLIMAVGASEGSFKDLLLHRLETLNFPSQDLATAFVSIYDNFFLTIIFHFQDLHEMERLKNAIIDTINEWKEKCLSDLKELEKTAFSI